MSKLFEVNPQQAEEIAEKVIAENGDLYKLTAVERKIYYLSICQRYGLDPFSNPFDYLTQTIKEKVKENGITLERQRDRITLYPNQRAAYFFAQKHRISVNILGREFVDGMWIVDVAATTPTGQSMRDCGVVEVTNYVPKSTALKKAISQARRRAILALCGFSTEDEFIGEVISSEALDPPMDVLQAGEIPIAVIEGQKTLDLSPELLEKNEIQRESIMQKTDQYLQVLGWDNQKAREFLKQNYQGKNSRQKLTDSELIDFCNYLARKCES